MGLPEPVRTAVGPTILLQSGAYFDLLDPENSRFTIGDIAHGLAMTCRFAGQCSQFYSVAEHCWHASYLAPPELARAALMHDAAEAFIGDVTRPLKRLLPDYKRIEARIEAAIFARFGVERIDDPAIKLIDRQMLAVEQQQLMPAHADTWAVIDGMAIPEIALRLFNPVQARAAFLHRYARVSA